MWNTNVSEYVRACVCVLRFISFLNLWLQREGAAQKKLSCRCFLQNFCICNGFFFFLFSFQVHKLKYCQSFCRSLCYSDRIIFFFLCWFFPSLFIFIVFFRCMIWLSVYYWMSFYRHWTERRDSIPFGLPYACLIQLFLLLYCYGCSRW